MTIRKAIVFLFAVSMLMTTTAFAQNGDKLPKLNYTEYKLKNGLRVIMHEDKSTPIVAVNVWYHVGSKNEVPGRTGFAHLFEHMMFQGSKNYNNDFFTPLQEAGANLNGSTNPDRTNYYEVVPSNFLELALFMEADRMGGLLEAMTQEKLDNQRAVVQNERRQRYDNQPYGTAFEKIAEIMYPADHPYHWTTIGSLADLNAASMDDVKGFFRQYYVPNNASLVIAGDFDPKQAKAWVEKYFGPIATGSAITRPNPKTPVLSGEIRKTYEDDVRLPRLYMAWHTSAAGSKDEPALDILGAILSSGRGSRLQKKMVYDQQSVQSIFATNQTREIGGSFLVVATARPGGKTLEEIEKDVNAELEMIKTAPPTQEEINRAVNDIESSFVFGLQTVLGKADQMNGNATFYGKPDLFQKQLDEYRTVTPAEVQRVAKEYVNGNRLVMSFVPRKGARPAGEVAKAESSEAKKVKDTKDYSVNLPKAGADPKFSLPPVEKKKLSNGLEVWMVRQPELPIVSMNLVLNTGGAANPVGKEGLSSVTAALIDAGTKTRSAVEIANGLQSIGANFGAGSGWDETNISLQALTKNLDPALAIYSDIITSPAFPADELETQRKRALVAFIQRKDNPNAISNVVYNALLYGKDHPYGKSLGGDEASVKGLKREDVVGFYETYYRPNNAALIVVGDVDSKTLIPKLEKAFAGWKQSEVSAIKTPEAKAFDAPGIYIVDKPGAAQSVISIGQIGVPRDNPDYFPLQVMNSILGGQFSARVNMNLREDKGYTYGARSGFSFRRGAGPFLASADVKTAVTKESVMEFMKELNGIRGAIPVTKEELEYNKQSIIRRFPRTVETVGQISASLAELYTYNLSANYYNDYIQKVNAVTVEDINRVANKYLSPDKMAIVIVGDKATIEPKLKEIDIWGNKILFLDTDGNPIE